MKNVLPKLMIVLLFNLQSVFAYPPHAYDYNLYNASTFEIKLTGNGFMTVSLDGEYFGSPVKKFSLNNIPAGNHFVEIFTEKIQHSGYYSNTQRVKIYSGNVYIKPSSLISAVVDNFGRFYIKNVQQLMTYTEPYYEPYDPYCQPDVHQHENYYNDPIIMQEPAFKQLLYVIEDQWYDDSKLQVAQQALQSNWFTTAQVARMMNTMWYEDTKLELAKSAYSKVLDKSDYYLVNKEFWYSSSVESLSKYILTVR
jgi:hypothetical protein